MTFRVDGAHRMVVDGASPHAPESGTIWRFSIKGLYGSGIYASLQTDVSGRGLTVNFMDVGKLRDDQRAEILDASEFQVPVDADTSLAMRLVGEALLKVGWGPQVDGQGNKIA